MKNYLNDLVCACSPDDGFAQDAIEHAIISGWIPNLTYLLAVDIPLVMTRYDSIVAGYQSVLRGANKSIAA